MEGNDGRIKKNLKSSIIQQFVLISISFLLPRLYLENFGSSVNGVLSTIKQIFTYMCLLEAGVGAATKHALYEILEIDDRKSVSEVLSATHICYRKTGIIYTLIVFVIAFVYGFVIDTGINSFIVFLLVILNGIPGIFNYFIQSKYRVLMEADGRNFVLNNSETVVQILANTGKILVLFLTDSLILIQLVYCVIALGQIVYLYRYAKREYKWLDIKTTPDFDAISQKDSALVHQVSGMVFNNTDVLLISALCNFTSASVYAIYNMFFAQMQTVISSVALSFSHRLGKDYKPNRQKFDKEFYVYEVFYIMCAFIIYTLMAVFLLPLIEIYTKGINDADYINSNLLMLFAVMQLLSNAKLPANNIIEYAGTFKKTRSHALWEMTINIVTTVIGIKLFGICGAILGTILALIYRSIVVIAHSNKEVLNRSLFKTYKLWLVNGGVFILVMVIFFVDSFSGLSFGKLVIKGLIHGPWIVALYVVANLIFNPDAFRFLYKFLKGDKL